MSDTPDVDTYIENQTNLHPNGGIAEFVRGIARERNEAIMQRDKLATLAEKILSDYESEIHCSIECECSRRRIAKSHREKLTELERIAP
jgi:hypothetical protein